MARRSLFSKFFGTNDSKSSVGTVVKLLNGYEASFTPYNEGIYDNVDVRTCIDTIARNAAKLNPKYMRDEKSGMSSQIHSSLQKVLNEKPNELMNSYDFFYKVISELYLHNNSFVYIARNETGRCIGLYPITSGNYKLYEYKDEIFIQFTFGSGKRYTASIKDTIHLKRMFCENDVFGGNNQPIYNVLSIKNVIDQGVINTIKTTQAIRGVLKSTKAILKPEDVKKMRDNFVTDFLKSADGSGIGGLDATTDFNAINLNPQTATDTQVQEYDKKVMKYFGVNENIIMNKYSEDEWNAFYESVLEPLGLMMSLEFTNKIFTLNERNHGNKIVFESNRLQYASNSTKVNVAKNMGNYMTINEIREIWNLPPIEDGDKILQSLNYVDSSIANDYQLNADSDKDEDKGGEDNE